ncbi:MAG TPA: Gfo/Idh/MocA family oxidoreductase, partial [Spirochaetia bacterium]|nr:Gfo/Idh/MocA family oxidoreductase [Spirochaetia bacterium]
MTFKAGVIGKGFIGPAHAEALARLGNVKVVAIAGSDEVASKAKAASLGIARGYGDWRRLVHDEEVQVVHVCSPNDLHFDMAKEALEAGKHVVCEKPLTVSIQQAEQLVELAEKKKLVNTVHFNIRYYPLMQHLHEIVAKGELGSIFSVHGSYLQDWLYYPTDYNWRLEQTQSGSSRAVADIGSHWLDLVEFVSGSRIEEVLADFQTFHTTRKKPRGPVETFAGKMRKPEDYSDIKIESEDYASVLLRFAGGARGVMTVSQVSAGRKNRLSFELDGSKRSAFWDSETPNQMWIGRRDGNNEIVMKDPSLLDPTAARTADYPGGHNEGFPDS